MRQTGRAPGIVRGATIGLSLIVASALAATSAHAQAGARDTSRTHLAQREHARADHKRSTPQERTDRQLAMLTRRLTLTSDQASRIKPILMDENERIAKIQEGAAGKSRSDWQAARKQIADIHTATTARVDSVLTPTQRDSYTKMQTATRKGGMKGGRRGPGRNR